jgi:hypothetical protein
MIVFLVFCFLSWIQKQMGIALQLKSPSPALKCMFGFELFGLKNFVELSKLSSFAGYLLYSWPAINLLLDRVSTPKVSAALASLVSSVTRILLFFFASARYAES